MSGLHIDAGHEMFVALAENSNDAFVIARPDGSVEYVNDACQALVDPTRLRARNARDDRAHRPLPWRRDPARERRRTVAVEFNAFEIFDSQGVCLGLATVCRDRAS